MPVRMRLQRHGRKKRPFYHIVVADGRAPRDGRFIERLGIYDPTKVPAVIEIDRDKALEWLNKGAEPTKTVKAILRFTGVLYKKHLLRGVSKGALTEEQAETKFNQWLEEKTAKIESRKAAVEDGKSAAIKKQEDAEKAARMARQVTAAEEAAEKAKEAEKAAAKEAEEAAAAAAPEEEAKAEEPKAEEAAAPVAEEPKAEEPKAEEAAAPVAEEPKAEEPKAEEPKVEEAAAPVAEEPKAEEAAAPVAEEPKAEEPKAEEAAAPVAEEPKAEEPKAEEAAAPVAEEPKAEETENSGIAGAVGAGLAGSVVVDAVTGEEVPDSVLEEIDASGVEIIEADDLTKIEGIGPKTLEIFLGKGIVSFKDLAAKSVDDLKAILEAEGLAHFVPDTWPKQAEMAAEGKWDELKVWQDELDGGKA